MVYLFISLVFYVIQNFSNKQFGKKYTSHSLFQNFLCVAVAATVLAVLGYAKAVPYIVLITAFVYGVLYLGAIFSLLKAISLGTLGIPTMIMNCANIIGAVFGIFYSNDAFSIFTIFGIVAMMLVIILCAPTSKNSDKTDKKWFIYSVAAALCNGSLSVIKRLFTTNYPNIQNGTFLFWSFLTASLIAAVILCSSKAKRKTVVECFGTPVFSLSAGLGAGIGTAGGNMFMLSALSSGLSSAIVFPLHSGLLSMLLMLMSIVIYREVKVTFKNVFALIICILGTVLINL